MNTKKITYGLAAILLAGSIAFTSCKKKSATAEDSDTSEASDHTMAENTSNDVINIGSQATDNTSGGLNSYKNGDPDVLSTCATVTRDTATKIVTVTFSGGTCLDGRTRSGVITFDYSQSATGAIHYRDPGFKCVVGFNGYSVDGNVVSNTSSHTVTNTTAVGFDPATTNLTWSVVTNMSITKSGGGVVSFSGTRLKTLLNTSDSNVYHGSSTPISWNLARVGTGGNVTGTTASGNTFTANVSTQLIRDFSCNVNGRHPFIQGSLDFTPGTKPTRHIDFGNGACDNVATVTISGHVYTITLH